MKKLKVIILARGGSKGVPRKNIRKINDIHLIGYPILASKDSQNISEVYVSTEDDEIKKVALDYGAKVIDRPSELPRDKSLDIDGMRHAVKHLQSYDDIVHLRASTPMVDSNVIDDTIEYFWENPNCTSLRSAHEASETAYKSFKKNEDGTWGGLFDHQLEGDYYNLPRQSLPKTYHPNGYIDIIRPKHFMTHNNLHGEKMLAFVTPFSYEVDTMDDFKILKVLYDKDTK